MADFGFWELALIMLVALVVVGPERLPKLAVQVGEMFGKFKRLAHNFKEDIADAADDDLRNTIEDQRNVLSQVGQDINKRLRSLDPLASSMEKQIEAGRFADAGHPDETMGEDASKPAEDSPKPQDQTSDKRKLSSAADDADQS